MAKHIHIHLHKKVRDNTAHDPSNGQFTSGGGGSGAGASKEKEKPAKHTPVTGIYSPTTKGYANGYTTSPEKHRETSHMIGGKEKPAKRLGVFHKGERIGHVESYRGHKDGPKINAAGVVAYRRDALQYVGSHSKGASSFGNPTHAEAIRQVVIAHEQHLDQNKEAK